MDNKTILLHSRFTTALRRAGNPFDLMKFINDENYAMVVLADALRSADPELLQPALEIGALRGLLSQLLQPDAPRKSAGTQSKGSEAQTSPAPEGGDEQVSRPRYVRSLR